GAHADSTSQCRRRRKAGLWAVDLPLVSVREQLLKAVVDRLDRHFCCVLTDKQVRGEAVDQRNQARRRDRGIDGGRYLTGFLGGSQLSADDSVETIPCLPNELPELVVDGCA